MVIGCSKDDEPKAPAEVVKTKVKITSYRIDNIPFTTSAGLGWDGVNGKPDVYTGLFNGNSLVIDSNVTTDVSQSMLPLTYTYNNPYLVPAFSNTINVLVMDSDSSTLWTTSDDEIGYVPFIMSDYTTGTNKYPPTVTKTANGVTATLLLTWE